MEHFILVILAFAAWLAQRINSARKKEAARRNGQAVAVGPHGEPVRTAAPDAAERTRQVREEVARKIAERRILMRPSARPAPAPRPASPLPAMVTATERETGSEFESAREPERSWFEQESRPTPPPVTAPAAAPAGIPKYQPAMTALPPLPATLPTLVEAAPPARAGGVWLEELRQPATARRAILLTEILGRPVGLRD